ncbi:carboxypeptidase-like regulatory domain-containing protein [Nocardioides sp. W7]|uniref:carboxypeptidase-like regulatory domain-containing protein n=1 Tax=Nocardioides sp. W7 TaxID=2931390 RepID=UPI001FD5F65E|nr:carboxypeptidase-like regulatory domain-containing protein [Nocardioides sp. W7]
MSAAPTPALPLRLRLRKAAIATLSLLVVSGGVLYVVAPASPTLDASFGEIAGDPPGFDRDLSVDYSLAAAEVTERRRFRETFYGSITSAGVPVRNARLIITGVQRSTKGLRATARIGGTGSYRAKVSLKPGRYRVTITLKAGGKTRTISKTRRLRNNRSYRASVKVRESGIVTMLPISSY